MRRSLGRKDCCGDATDCGGTGRTHVSAPVHRAAHRPPPLLQFGLGCSESERFRASRQNLERHARILPEPPASGAMDALFNCQPVPGRFDASSAAEGVDLPHVALAHAHGLARSVLLSVALGRTRVSSARLVGTSAMEAQHEEKHNTAVVVRQDRWWMWHCTKRLVRTGAAQAQAYRSATLSARWINVEDDDADLQQQPRSVRCPPTGHRPNTSPHPAPAGRACLLSKSSHPQIHLFTMHTHAPSV